jgi:hypothetical protein
MNDRLRKLLFLKGRLVYGEGVPFFDADGNRSDGTGEHVIWLHPVRENGRLAPRAVIRVIRLSSQALPRREWQTVGTLNVTYDWPARPTRAEP